MKHKRNDEAGYIALTSALIIAAILVVIVFTIGLNSFLGRNVVLTAYFKERSRALADGCVQVALLKLSQNSSYTGGETITVASDTCQIVSVTTSSSQKIIKTQAQFQNAFTNFQVTVNASDLSTVGWQETSSS